MDYYLISNTLKAVHYCDKMDAEQKNKLERLILSAFMNDDDIIVGQILNALYYFEEK